MASLRRCSHCNEPATDGKRLKPCKRCKVQYYCSEGCYQKDWPSHKEDCRKPEDRETTLCSRCNSIFDQPLEHISTPTSLWVAELFDYEVSAEQVNQSATQGCFVCFCIIRHTKPGRVVSQLRYTLRISEHLLAKNATLSLELKSPMTTGVMSRFELRVEEIDGQGHRY